MTNNIIESMLNQTLYNTILDKIKEGTLTIEDETIFIINNNNKYFLTYAPYENLDGKKITKKERKELCNIFINKYSYENILKMHKEIIEEKERKYKKAEENIIKLEEIINKYNLKQYGKVDIKFNHAIIESYILFKKNYKYNLEIYLNENSSYKIKYNYEWLTMNKEELTNLINEIIKNIEAEAEAEAEKRKKELEENKRLENKIIFAEKVSRGYVAIIKLKSSYQCLEGGLRYTVGKGAGKFYSLKGISNIIDYLNKKDVKEYAYISIEELENITIKELKQLEYREF